MGITTPSPSPSPVQLPARVNAAPLIVKQKSIIPTLTGDGIELASPLLAPYLSTTPSHCYLSTIQPRQLPEADPGFAAALQRQRDREEEEAKMLCSLENKEAYVMCSG